MAAGKRDPNEIFSTSYVWFSLESIVGTNTNMVSLL